MWYDTRKWVVTNAPLFPKVPCRFVVFLALACGQARAGEVEDRDAMAEAFIHWRNGNVLHLAGRYGQAAELFQQSIDAYPTAEGHTFLGWSLSKLGRLEDAIAECKKAIPLDSDYGNPYSDIGVYLIELERPEEAVPWLQKAITAKRYCCYEFPHFNLGRVLLSQGKIDKAKRSFKRALSHNPDYVPAIAGLEFIRENWGEDI